MHGPDLGFWTFEASLHHAARSRRNVHITQDETNSCRRNLQALWWLHAINVSRVVHDLPRTPMCENSKEPKKLARRCRSVSRASDKDRNMCITHNIKSRCMLASTIAAFTIARALDEKKIRQVSPSHRCLHDEAPERIEWCLHFGRGGFHNVGASVGGLHQEEAS